MLAWLMRVTSELLKLKPGLSWGSRTEPIRFKNYTWNVHKVGKDYNCESSGIFTFCTSAFSNFFNPPPSQSSTGPLKTLLGMFLRWGKIIIVNLQVFSPSAQLHFQTCSILLLLLMQVKGGPKLFVSKLFFVFFSCFTDGFCHFLRESSLLVIVCHSQKPRKEWCGQCCTDSRYFTVPEILGSGGIGFAIFFIFFIYFW